MAYSGKVTYDKNSDILYISTTNELVSVVSKELDNGILVRNNTETGEITSIAIIDFKARFKNLFYT